MNGARIVVAEDDAVNREFLVKHLNGEGFNAVEACDGFAALRATRERPDLAIMDLGLPGIDGLNVLRAARREGNKTPIIVLTGRAEEVDRIVCFELGADDYVLKPFFVRELICRIRAILRRYGNTEEEVKNAVLRYGQIEIDDLAREVRVGGKNAGLRPKEFALFSILAHNPGIALARKTLIERAWGYDYEGDDRTVDGHVRRIRHKLEDEFHVDPCIVTIYGFGYKFVTA